MKRLFDNVNEETYNSCFLACVIVCFLFSCTILGATYISNRQAAKDRDTMLNMIIAYIATATDDEYDQIAEEIRHDFIFRKWDERTRQFVQYIPNRAARCCACQRSHQPQMYLLAVNTGNLYAIAPETPQPSGTIRFASGYDEISQTSLNIVRDSYLDYDMLSLRQGNDVVSIHRMKNIFCDDCIDKILSTINGQTITSFVFFSAGDNLFYPVSDGQEMQGDDYTISTSYDIENREMRIKYYKDTY